MAPSAERVAARAHVGLRTVFRHFNDMEGLYREMASAIENELAVPLAAMLAGADWRGRLIGLIGKRAALYEKIAPFKRAADAHRQQIHLPGRRSRAHRLDRAARSSRTWFRRPFATTPPCSRCSTC